MKGLWSDLRAHRCSGLMFGALWIGGWILTALTWIDTPEQRGMHPVAVVAQLVMPVVAGGIVRFWRRAPLGLRVNLISLTGIVLVPAATWLLLSEAPGHIRLLSAAGTLLLVAPLAGVRGLGRSLLAGFLVMEASIVVVFLGSGVALLFGAVQPSPGEEVGAVGMLAEFVEWALFIGGLGLPLGWLGGLLVAVGDAAGRRLSGGGRSTAWG